MTAEPARHEVTVTLAGVEDAGELLTLQRAAYVTEARIYREPWRCTHAAAAPSTTASWST